MGKVTNPNDKRLGNKWSPGRPPKIKSVRHFKQSINSYFKSITREIVDTDQNGNVIATYEEYVKAPSLVGLALFMEMTKEALWTFIFTYRKHSDEFEDYKELYLLAKARCEAHLVEQLSNKNSYVKGQEFLLKNHHGYEDKITTENKTEIKQDVFDMSRLDNEQLAAYETLLKIGTVIEVDEDE